MFFCLFCLFGLKQSKMYKQNTEINFLTDLNISFLCRLYLFFHLYYYLLNIYPLQVLPKFMALEHEIPLIMQNVLKCYEIR